MTGILGDSTELVWPPLSSIWLTPWPRGLWPLSCRVSPVCLPAITQEAHSISRFWPLVLQTQKCGLMGLVSTDPSPLSVGQTRQTSSGVGGGGWWSVPMASAWTPGHGCPEETTHRPGQCPHLQGQCDLSPPATHKEVKL